MGYFCIKVIGISADNNWHYLATGLGRLVSGGTDRLRGPARLSLRPWACASGT
jgi:hypothetical protein